MEEEAAGEDYDGDQAEDGSWDVNVSVRWTCVVGWEVDSRADIVAKVSTGCDVVSGAGM